MTYLAIIPTQALFADVKADYARVLEYTRLDHTDLIELCLEHWVDLLEARSCHSEDYVLSFTAEVVTRRLRRRHFNCHDSMLAEYALQSVLGACGERLEDWIEIAQRQMGLISLSSIRAKQYVSSRALLVELLP